MKTILSFLFFLIAWSSFAQFSHIHKGFHLVAERVPSGGVVEMSVNKETPEDIVFPLPDGIYNIYITSPSDSSLATDYIRFNASVKNVEVSQGSVINITGGTTSQALILIDTTGIDNPVVATQVNG